MVIAGEHKGSEGKVMKVLPSENRAIVEGINLVSKHRKPSAEHPKGGIEKIEAPIHISNLALKDPKSGAPTRVGYRMEDNRKIRYAKKSNEAI